MFLSFNFMDFRRARLAAGRERDMAGGGGGGRGIFREREIVVGCCVVVVVGWDAV